MRRRVVLLGLPILMALTGCLREGAAPAAPDPDQRAGAFHQRAAEVAGAWRPSPAWTTGYVPLQGPILLLGDPGFSPDTEQAFLAGWYRDQIPMPTTRPPAGSIRFPDGTLTVPLISAAEAYRRLDQGDPPPCEGRPKEPRPTIEPGPDGPVASSVASCIPLTVTDVRLDSASVRTSRGDATVPAWIFTVDELTAPVARLAVAESAVSLVPEGVAPTGTPVGTMVAAQDLTAIEGTRLTWRIGIGACDTGATPLVAEFDGAVVVGGSVIQGTGECTAQLLLKPVTAVLREPLGTRAVLDVVTGTPLALVPR